MFSYTQQKALHMRSLRTFTDDSGVVRKNGVEWLITMQETETHIPNVYEEVRKTNEGKTFPLQTFAHAIYTEIFPGVKKKKNDIFNIFVKNIDCGYMLELPQRGDSNEYPQSKTRPPAPEANALTIMLLGLVIMLSGLICLDKILKGLQKLQVFAVYVAGNIHLKKKLGYIYTKITESTAI